jgi:predicted permease
MSVVVAALIPVFLLIAAGALVRRFLVTADDHWIGMSAWCISFCFQLC